MLLVNTVHFQQDFKVKFKRNTTYPQDFTQFDGVKRKVPMMHMKHPLRYCHNSDVSAVCLDFVHPDAMMVVILPNETGQNALLSAAEQYLEPQRFSALVEQCSWREIKLHLPKFELECEEELKDPLTALGMGEAFSDAADQVIHKTVLKVAENGVEAAAATVVIEDDGAGPPPASPPPQLVVRSSFILMEDLSSHTGTKSELSPSGMSLLLFSLIVKTSAFLNWDGTQITTIPDRITIFHSLISTVKHDNALDSASEEKIVQFLGHIMTLSTEEMEKLIVALVPSSSEESTQKFVNSIVVFVSSANQRITKEAMRIVNELLENSSPKFCLNLVKADLVPHLIASLHPQSLSLADAEDIHTFLMEAIAAGLWLGTPDGLLQLEIEHPSDRDTVHEIVLKHIIAISEPYLLHLCTQRFSIVDGSQSLQFMALLLRSSDSLHLISQHGHLCVMFRSLSRFQVVSHFH
ncbi:putative serpin family protein [Blattamonas nauphoetae]|uniref:Serpin family protein n=1 Tax=Blattamonas nauphoetae TaxID=2049346 RepID=A0ABQ9WLF9_9EUKA|nr:putative serpin family protein [Blattamonas nauphoetae]